MSLRLLTSGDSHGPELIAVLDGMPAGVRVEAERIDRQLARRQGGHGRGARSTKVEHDRVQLVSGVVAGLTTGAPVGIRIPNLDFANQPAHRPAMTTPRPGHADLAGAVKFGLDDLRLIRERASARETAARVAAGAVAAGLLEELGAELGSLVTAVGPIQLDVDLGRCSAAELRGLSAAAETSPVRCPDARVSDAMVEAIDRARVDRETLGGVFVVHCVGLPVGLGSHTQWDLRLDGQLAQALLSIPAVKGIEVGPAFEVAHSLGSSVQDEIRDSEGARATNFAGGLEGGMTDGQPLVLRCAMKPLSSVRAPLGSVDLATGEPAAPPYVRSDVCAVPAAAVVGEAMVALVLAEAVLSRFGGDRIDHIRAGVGR